jgi:phytoene dehydrogenase-like protein
MIEILGTYPDGGMSQFCRSMLAKFVELGGSVFFDSKVSDVAFENGLYYLRVNSSTFTSSALSIAIPGFDFGGMTVYLNAI